MSDAPHRWHPQPPRLSTPWTAEVGPGNALPEYPRPQLVRDEWLNLNGVWEYGADGGERVLVPYPPESALSGIARHDDRMRYRRAFEVPPDWDGRRVLLHFGAVNAEATVLVNGRVVAEHRGGYTGFSADITGALRPHGAQELVVQAFSELERGEYPIGKQRRVPDGILYTAGSGIWQTVWAEPVPPVHVTALDITPNLRAGAFVVTPRVAGGSALVDFAVRDTDGTVLARSCGPAGTPQLLRVTSPRAWSPDDPYLYDIVATVHDDDPEQGRDVVRSYAGLREIGIAPDERGRPRLALNNRVLFQLGPLDQGYWPDGAYTAPTDAALRHDLEQAKALGFNMVRKHVKIEPARFYYWADRLGLLVWQDMPSLPIDLSIPPGMEPPPTPGMRANFERELRAMLDQLRSVTSVVVWVPFNEGWGEYDTARIAALVRRADPSRLVVAQSGVNCCYSSPDTGAGDIYDDHTYVGPGAPVIADRRPTADGEYGGLGLVLDGHAWPGTPLAYEMAADADELTARYGDLGETLKRTIVDNGLSAAVYTQTTDVENEVNGLLTYDRRALKPNPEQVREHNRAAIAAGMGS